MDQPSTIPQGWKATKHHNSAVHRATGEKAIVQTNGSGYAYAQFDRFDHPQSHGWHRYPEADFQFHDEDPFANGHPDDRVGNQAGYTP